jgi:hypothetical protein
MSYPCPQCGDRGTQSLPMLTKQSTGEGAHSDTITALAREYAPPESFHWGYGLLLWIAMSAAIRFAAGSRTILANLGALLAFVVFIFVGAGYNHRVWEPAMNRWEQSFICRACGRVFRP